LQSRNGQPVHEGASLWKIVNVAAASALRGYYGVADYASAKAGIVAFTINAAKELQPLNIQVNAIIPVAQSRMIDSLGDYYKRAFGEKAASESRRSRRPTRWCLRSCSSPVVTQTT
jgi:NAD(P)-dependent dehydrogenase (short-subunit alcohol dehydrogenase family)